MPDDQRSEILEQITFLASQAAAAAADRKPSIVKATLEMLGKTASTINSIAMTWKVVEPVLQSIFS